MGDGYKASGSAYLAWHKTLGDHTESELLAKEYTKRQVRSRGLFPLCLKQSAVSKYAISKLMLQCVISCDTQFHVWNCLTYLGQMYTGAIARRGRC